MIDIPLARGTILRVDPAHRLVETIFCDGKRVAGTRDPNQQNRDEAASQGYTPDAEGCWRSLVEHEALHSIVAVDLWPHAMSFALRQEAGELAPYWARLHEEAVVLTFQMWANGQRLQAPLTPYIACLSRWIQALAGVRRAMGWEPPPQATPPQMPEAA